MREDCCFYLCRILSGQLKSVSVVLTSVDVLAGSVIRCMRRLEETLRQMVQASKAIGNTELENKFAEGQFLQRMITRLFGVQCVFYEYNET